ncbi:hypothetical protein MUK42_12572 [Musa troglodytarum]|uniref:C2H2-type domain-containing protein n=1 Tax=Musa troglodytarum TaxID=320322 RepID=A0A9E7KLF9_9LILI|nr:hypothetical protein MUK42_12572 [Musa troglodytarum]
MDAVEEAMDHDKHSSGSSSSTKSNEQFNPCTVVVKGKRTKRHRTVVVVATAAPDSSTSSAEICSSNTNGEEEDMANCLVLLAQGRGFDASVETVTGTVVADGKAGGCVYRCKTCDKCFPSFRALGGHRTSHKKPKAAAAAIDEDDGLQISTDSGISKQVDRPRVHECSICGSSFSSGRALGGHMRRHRPTTKTGTLESKKEKNVLSLDLNLPAPSDDDHQELSKPPPAVVAFRFES